MATILVVDNVEENRTLLEGSLEGDGHTVWSEPDGTAALEKVKEQQPDVIFLDIDMPEMDGLEILAHLKTEEKLKDIPVIMVMAKNVEEGTDDEEGIIKALDLGAYDCVTKPFSFPLLAARMRTSLRLKRRHDDLRRTNQRLSVMSTTDLLTGLYNRRLFLNLANKEMAKAHKFDRQLIMLSVGIDCLKTVNDEYGNSCGDKIIIQLSNIFKKEFTSAEIVGRINGGDFAVCLSDTSSEEAMDIAENIRLVMEGEDLNLGEVYDDKAILSTVSIGLCELKPEDDDATSLVTRAEIALHQAKNAGRNCIVHGDTNETIKGEKKVVVSDKVAEDPQNDDVDAILTSASESSVATDDVETTSITEEADLQAIDENTGDETDELVVTEDVAEKESAVASDDIDSILDAVDDKKAPPSNSDIDGILDNV